MASDLHSCSCCGLIQRVPDSDPKSSWACHRCASTLQQRNPSALRQSMLWTIASLLLYPAAITLPLLRVERLGHAHQDGLLSGVLALLHEGHLFVGMVVLLFSIVLPPVKLFLLLWLGLIARKAEAAHRATAYHLIEAAGRWGMLDVMLVALLVAFVKLGDLVSIHAGPGLLAFTFMVLGSLIASAKFNPHLLWDEDESS